MDLDNLQTVTQLSQEKMAIQRALLTLNSGGRITAMTMGMPGGAPIPAGLSGVTVSTTYIDYPPQMVDAIKASFDDRLHAIEDELSQLGVTGLPSR